MELRKPKGRDELMLPQLQRRTEHISDVCGVMAATFAESLLQKLPLMPECAYKNMAAKRCEFAKRLWSLRKRST
ncbi:unnamed protein product [Cuscuta europaea]|uniref:Uncharacterized protein n=1 Tax=Cuscuta europaea TaxID=41803 RepID=A0A9P0ZBQ2_CUSEU|nr:unnamed protein product [Cuscuta europaea]